MQDLAHLQSRLLAIHPGTFQPDHYLLPWCSPSVVTLLNTHAVEVKPRRVVYDAGERLRCHERALRYATEHGEAQAYFGFGLYDDDLWWLHSVCLYPDGTLIDSAPATPPTPFHFVGIMWGRELYEAIPKREGVGTVELPPVLRRSGCLSRE